MKGEWTIPLANIPFRLTQASLTEVEFHVHYMRASVSYSLMN